MASPESLADVFEEGLKDIFSAENQLLKALPKMAKKASNQNLKGAFLAHAKETEGQIERLKQLGESLEIKLTGKVCKAMQGLIEEGKEVLEEESENPALIDIMLITAAQKCEHYEISGYGSLSAVAQALGYDEAVELLDATLEEESATDEKLTQISQDEIMDEAKASGEGDEEGDEDEEEDTSSVPARKAPASRKSITAKTK